MIIEYIHLSLYRWGPDRYVDKRAGQESLSYVTTTTVLR